MNARIVLLVTVCLVVASGCTVISFYPLYTQDKLIRDDRIIGKWESYTDDFRKDTLVWSISISDKKWNKKVNNPFDRGDREVPNNYTYTLDLYYKSEPKDSGVFNLHIVKLGNQTYLDFYPEQWNNNNDIMAVHLVPVHTFAKAKINNDLEIQWFDSDWLQGLFDENKIRIEHMSNHDYTLLTAKPEELQKFVVKYANEQEAFSDDLKYTLRRI